MIFKIVSFGHKRDAFFLPILSHYQKQMRHPWSIEFVDFPSQRQHEKEPKDIVLKKEAAFFLSKITGEFWVLSVTGKMFTSEDFALLLKKEENKARQVLVLLIGGADGVDKDLEIQAIRKLSLSTMTMTHRFARALLSEQIYRAQAILNHLPYHSGH